MSTPIGALDERYGRTRISRRLRRRRVIIGAATVLILATAWAVLTGFGGATTAIDVETTGVVVHGDETTVVQWLVAGRSGTRLVCAIQAQDDQGAVVGLREVVVRASRSANRIGVTTVRTVRRASTGLIQSCRDA